MAKKMQSIPVNNWSKAFSEGIVISRTLFEDASTFDEVGESHRDTWHLFILQEKGSTTIEIDFQKHVIESPAVIYIHPNQVHRLLAFKNAAISTWAINNENLKPEYLKLLEDITPVNVLHLDEEAFSIIIETVSIGLKYAERKQEILYSSLLKDNCNTLVAFVVSQYLAQNKITDRSSRFEVVTKAFKAALEHSFKTVKSPALYASNLNLSAPYLNECVKNVTGQSVSHHIQQRIILEAERLLYHSDKSVKEIAYELGYEDHSYFIRLFTKATSMTPLSFRKKNHE